ncbi:MAG: hypothetical protein A2X59_12675 [Nitrospirae bacterium GWC2_42_7]|nr:MAG: hypothetical protein A2X59_12675 [Nitrospirae bacterium GWC2_42_7]
MIKSIRASGIDFFFVIPASKARREFFFKKDSGQAGMTDFILRSLLMVCSLLIMLFFSVSAAYGNTEYTIKKGDNLYNIAKKYHVSVQDIKKVNDLSSSKLKPGNKILLPVSDSTDMQVKTINIKEQKTSTSNKISDNSKNIKEKTILQVSSTSDKSLYHTVKKGEVLSVIAKQYSVTVAEIKEMNHLRYSRLKIGQKLLLKQEGPRTYTARKGDNIWKIAKRFDLDGEELMEINEMETPSLRIGQVLFLEEKAAPDDTIINKEELAKKLEEEINKMAESSESLEKSKTSRLVEFAKKLVNIPYKFGGNSILGIDCSAYVKKVYGLLGVELPRTAREQFSEGESVAKNELSVGDLVFFRTYASFPSHVGIYLGNNLFIHASSKGKKVAIDNLDKPYYLKRFLGGKRLLKDEAREMDDQS